MIQSAVPQKLYELALVLVAHQPSDKLTHVDTLTVADIDLLQTWRQAVNERGRGKKKSEGSHGKSEQLSALFFEVQQFEPTTLPRHGAVPLQRFAPIQRLRAAGHSCPETASAHPWRSGHHC